MQESSVSDIVLAAMYKRRWREDMQIQPFARGAENTANDGIASSSLDDARVAHCPGLNTSASEALHPFL